MSSDSAHSLLRFYYSSPSPVQESPPSRRRHRASQQEQREQRHRQGLRQSLFLHTSPHHTLAVSRRAGSVDDPDVAVAWEHVRLVTCLSSATADAAGSNFLAAAQCPICIEDTVVAPRITRCGHVFCFPCILAHLHTDSKMRCPCCSQPLAIQDLRPAQFSTVLYPHSGGIMAFSRAISHRISYVDSDALLRKLHADLRQLQQLSTHDSYYATMAAQAITCETHTAAVEADWETAAAAAAARTIPPLADSSTHSVLYQAEDGQLCFLSEFNMQCLDADLQHRDNPTYPPRIQGQILHVSRMHITPQLRHKLHLTHLPLYTDVTLVELNLHHILSPHTKLLFKDLLDQRKRERRREKRKTEKRDKATHSQPWRSSYTAGIPQPTLIEPPTLDSLNLEDDFGPYLQTRPASNNNMHPTIAPEFTYRAVCKSGGLFPSLPTIPKP